MILDTAFIIDVLRGDESVEGHLADLDRSSPLHVSAVSVMELWEGIHLSDSTNRERQAVREVLEGLTELPFDRACAMRAGKLNAELRKRGRSIEAADAMIAATALVRDRPVVTRNVSHFDHIEGLEVISY